MLNIMDRLGRTLARCLLALLLLGAFMPAQGNISETITKSAMKRAMRSAEAKLVGKAIYRRLPAHVEKSFKDHVYSQRVLKQKLIAYRYHSPMNDKPRDMFVYVTTDKYASEKMLRERLALSPIDNARGKHITQVDVYHLPHNTLVSEGTVGPMSGYKGGGYQIVLENPPTAWIVDKISFKTWRASLGQ